MGVTERLARACAAHPRRTLALWGVAVVVALALVATSLHGLSTQAHVIGNPQSTKAKNAIESAFPGAVADEKEDVILRDLAALRRAIAPVPRLPEAARGELQATGEISGARLVAVSPDRHAALVAVPIKSDSGAKQVEQVIQDANRGGFSVGITGYHTVSYDFGKQSQKDLETRRARVRPPGRADRPHARLRRRRRGARAGADGDPLDHRRASGSSPSSRSSSRSRSSS